jgi:hypothetical protein
MSMAEELAKLAELRSSGVLTEDEFAVQKARLLAPQEAPAPAAVSPAPTDVKGPGGTKTVSESLGPVMLVLPLLATALIELWIGSMTLFDRPMTPLTAIVVVTVVATAVLVAIEANNFGMGGETDLRPNGKRREGPGEWFAGMLVLWFVAFPLYLNRRALYGVRRLLWPGLGAVLILSLSAGYMAAQIESKTKEIEVDRLRRQVESRKRLDELQGGSFRPAPEVERVPEKSSPTRSRPTPGMAPCNKNDPLSDC